jgi:hypothetical protein
MKNDKKALKNHFFSIKFIFSKVTQPKIISNFSNYLAYLNTNVKCIMEKVCGVESAIFRIIFEKTVKTHFYEKKHTISQITRLQLRKNSANWFLQL